MPKLMADADFAKQIWELKIQSIVKEAKIFEKKRNYKQCGVSMWAAADAQPAAAAEPVFAVLAHVATIAAIVVRKHEPCIVRPFYSCGSISNAPLAHYREI